MEQDKNTNQENLEQQEKEQQKTPSPAGFVRIKKFHFAMLILLLVLSTAGITTFALTFQEDDVLDKVNERKEFSKFYDAYDKLKLEYYKEIEDSRLINGAINGMIDSLDDPYSDYMSEDEASSFHESISSSFEGIGAEIQEKDGHIVIVSPIKGAPAEKAGIKPNDIVLSVDGESLQGMSSTEAVTIIRGEKGTKVELTIQRPGQDEPIVVTIIRDTIPLETVHGEMLEDKIAHVQISSFSQNTTTELVDVLNELKEKGMKGLVLDVRQNPGGLLEQAINISSLFVPYGEIIFKVEDRDGHVKEYKSKNKDVVDIPLVVVIDKGSASASEILAAAVSESASIPLVGQKSFGKGTVQRAQDFRDGSNIKFTTEKWLTPKGNWIHEKGVIPDYSIELPDYASLTYINPDKEWKINMSGSEIQSAQKMLKEIGYNPGREDGFFDEKTKQAVISLQKDKGMKADGILKKDTTMALMEGLREKIEKNDTQILEAVKVLKKEIGS